MRSRAPARTSSFWAVIIRLTILEAGSPDTRIGGAGPSVTLPPRCTPADVIR